MRPGEVHRLTLDLAPFRVRMAVRFGTGSTLCQAFDEALREVQTAADPIPRLDGSEPNDPDRHEAVRLLRAADDALERFCDAAAETIGETQLRTPSRRA